MSFWKLSNEDVLARIAAPKPTPGGGSVAILAGCLGSALLRKALAVSKAKCPECDRSVELRNSLDKTESLEQSLRDCTCRDSDALNAYFGARRLPRETATERNISDAATERALLEAAEVPVAAAATMQAIVSEALRILPSIHVVILSDAIGGLHLLNTSATILLATADSNLAITPSSAQSARLTTQVHELRLAIRRADSALDAQLRSWAMVHTFSNEAFERNTTDGRTQRPTDEALVCGGLCDNFPLE